MNLGTRKYEDSTPHLRVGDSAFEHWFQDQSFACQEGIKQMCRDSYAAGMGDPLVVALDCLPPSATVAEIDKARRLYGTEMVQIDDDAKASHYDTGVWVQAWLDVEDEE